MRLHENREQSKLAHARNAPESPNTKISDNIGSACGNANIQNPTADIKSAAQAALNARDLFPDSTFADLYDPAAMPPRLLKAHQKLDKAVDRAYRKTAFANEAERVAFLFDLYQQYTAPAIDPARK